MNLPSASLKLTVSFAAFLFGIYLLYEASFVDVPSTISLFFAGAVCSALGLKIALDSLQWILWHKLLSRHSLRLLRRRS